MSDNLISVKSEILNTFCRLKDTELDEIEKWICSNSYKKELEAKKSMNKTEKILIKIGNTIRKLVPIKGEMPTEKIVPPLVGDQADCNAINTSHIDEFLYDSDEVQELFKEGTFQLHYCLDCNSRNTKELTLISHSMSREVLQYIFHVLLPKELTGKQLLDVGSRIGAVLYGAYYYSNASTIIGIEMNEDCCKVQERIISEYLMDSNRIKVINSDVMERSDIVQSSDVIIINVLDFFVDIEKHKQMWYFFKKHIKKGSYLVCSRSMADTLGYLDIFEELMDWLSICKPCQIENEILFDVDSCCDLFVYTVN